MPYIAVDRNGDECIFMNEPKRNKYDEWENIECVEGEYYNDVIYLNKGTIKKLIDRDITWNDKPVEI